MIKKNLLPFLLFLPFCSLSLTAQNIYPDVQVLDSGMNTSIRGISVVNDNVVWVSGSNGMVGKSSNGGKNWKWMTVKGFEKNDFRDIEAFDASTAVIMSIADPAYILKTTDGGGTWKIVYQNDTRGMFLDAMDFSNPNEGMVIGDPVDGHFFMARTKDGGDSWQELKMEERPVADSGEAFFAASGSNISYLFNTSYVYVSGGTASRIFSNETAPAPLPLIQGKETTGANAIAVWDDYSKHAGRRMVVTGGDFNDPASSDKNCFYTTDRGKTWRSPATPPHGYRSCVEFLSKTNLVACGLTGVDYSTDGGRTWKLISPIGFHTCQFAKFGSSLYLAGSNGKIARLHWR